MSLFSFKAAKKPSAPPFDPAAEEPAIRCSICTGEQVAGFRHEDTGRFEEVMLLRGPGDLEAFKKRYGLTGEIEKFY